MIEDLLKKYGIKPNKRLGQNFLIDESVLEKIISAADLSKNDTVLEIGPGLGILTIELAKRAKQVIAAEKDKKLAEILGYELKIRNTRNVKIINEDALKIFNKISLTNYKIVANLPYYLTSPLIRMFLEAKNKPEIMVLMLQKEVAQRICVQPPEMSILAIAVQFYAQPQIISIVLKTSFYPQPKVDSAIIKMKPSPVPKIDTEKFFRLVKAGFSAKRKFLINNLSRNLKIENCKLKIVFDQIQLGQKLRAENLSVENWINLYEQIKNNF